MVAALLLTWPEARGQANPACKVQPHTLAEMHGCYRPLLVFAPSAGDGRLKAQRDVLDHAADDMMDRFVLMVPILEHRGSFTAPLDAPYAVLSPEAQSSIRRRFSVAPGRFKVVLIGEDGGAKLQADAPVTADRLNTLIDRMPTRKIEADRPHAN
jgi:hypothetical protein